MQFVSSSVRLYEKTWFLFLIVSQMQLKARLSIYQTMFKILKPWLPFCWMKEGNSFHLAIKLMVIVPIFQSNLSCPAAMMCRTDLFCNNIHLLLHIFCVFKIKKNNNQGTGMAFYCWLTVVTLPAPWAWSVPPIPHRWGRVRPPKLHRTAPGQPHPIKSICPTPIHIELDVSCSCLCS